MADIIALGFDENGQMVGTGMDVVNKWLVDKFGGNITSFMARVNAGQSVVNGVAIREVGSFEDGFNRWIDGSSMQHAQFNTAYQSILTLAAYNLALTKNRRVTDADFDAAFRMLGGSNVHPMNALSAVRSQINSADARAAVWPKIYADGGAYEGTRDKRIMDEAYGFYVDERDLALEALDRAADAYKQFIGVDPGTTPQAMFLSTEDLRARVIARREEVKEGWYQDSGQAIADEVRASSAGGPVITAQPTVVSP